jgi:allantoinase
LSDVFDLVIRAPRAILPEGEAARGIGVRDGRIEAILSLDASPKAAKVVELGPDEVLLPGLVDSHVHVCEPGNTEWEGFETATKAAAAGGITTLVDMPLDSSPTTVTVQALEVKRQAAEGKCHIDVGFWGGVIPGNLADLVPLRDAGVLGFKCFLADSGSDEFPPVDGREMREALQVVRELRLPLLVHAESAEAAASIPEVYTRSYREWLAAHPRGLENLAVAQVIEAARETGGHAHIVHLSSSDTLPMLATARGEGVPVTTETAPHYLSFSAEEIPDGGTALKCLPPIREAANREALWEALRSGLIDMIVSDHSPSIPALKELESGDFGRAWGGVSSLEVTASAVWTQARRRGYTLSQLAAWMSWSPAQLAGLPQKGAIAVGRDADFCVFAPDEAFVVRPDTLHQRHPVTPYAGLELMGVVHATFLRGQRLDLERPLGRLLRPDEAESGLHPEPRAQSRP